MQLKGNRRGDELYLYLLGELDEHSVPQVRGEADRLIEENGFLIGRYKKLQKYGMGMYLENPNFGADKILELSGVYSLIPKL